MHVKIVIINLLRKFISLILMNAEQPAPSAADQSEHQTSRPNRDSICWLLTSMHAVSQ